MTSCRLTRVLFPLLTLVVLCAASSAYAGLFRAYLSAAGNDANPCTLQKPCRLLPAALVAVSDSGEIWMMDSANYNVSQVVVDKSVTILAVPGALGSLIATNGMNALFISASGVNITLRNLVIAPLGLSNNGIEVIAPGELHVEGCTISGMAGSGIAVLALGFATKVTITNTVLRGNSDKGFYAGGGVDAVLDGLHIESNNIGIYVEPQQPLIGPVVTINNSVFAHNTTGAFIMPPAVIYTRQNNTFSLNSTDVTGLGGFGALTPLGAK